MLVNQYRLTSFCAIHISETICLYLNQCLFKIQSKYLKMPGLFTVMEPQWSFGERNVVVYSLSHFWLFVTPWTAARQTPLSSTFSFEIRSNSCLLRWSHYLTISSSATPFSFCLQSLPASGSFPMSWLFA